MKRLIVSLLLALTLVALPGCGGDGGDGESVAERVERLRERAEAETERLRERASDETKKLRQRADERLDEIRREGRRVRRDIEARVREAFEEFRRAVPRADEQTRPPRRSGTGSATDTFLRQVLDSNEAYWATTFRAADLRAPQAQYLTVPEGRAATTGCGASADDTAAFYCPADDTIYVGERLADGVLRGVISGFPGERAEGRAVGDFGVAYIVAHEFAHNVQQEQGVLDDDRRGASARPFELQADCLAGTWGASVYRAGDLQEGDVEEALSTALAVGDFEVGSQEHHGTPEERRDAWLLGFESGDPSRCSAFLGV